jgi:hypothetical protein
VATRVYLEVGTTRTFACAVDWVGWARSARAPRSAGGGSPEAALEAFAGYLPRYAPVAAATGLVLPPGAADDLLVVEQLAGDMTTDFGAPSLVPAVDGEPLAAGEGDRLAALLAAAWQYLDDVAARSPATLTKGPRGGGRDRDAVVRHVVDAEASYVRKLGLSAGARSPVEVWRPAVLALLREDPTAATAPTTWPLRYAARRIAWHVLDHAWEIEDRSAHPV